MIFFIQKQIAFVFNTWFNSKGTVLCNVQYYDLVYDIVLLICLCPLKQINYDTMLRYCPNTCNDTCNGSAVTKTTKFQLKPQNKRQWNCDWSCLKTFLTYSPLFRPGPVKSKHISWNALYSYNMKQLLFASTVRSHTHTLIYTSKARIQILRIRLGQNIYQDRCTLKRW